MSLPDRLDSDAREVRKPAEYADTRTLVVLAGVVATSIAGVYWVLRTGFDNPVAPVLKSLALAFWLFTAPLVARGVLARRSDIARNHWTRSFAFLWLMTFGVTGIVGRLVPVVGFNPFIVLGAIGVVAY